MKCSRCYKEIDGKPIVFDLKKYTGSYRGYEQKYRFSFCNECYEKVVRVIKDNKIKPVKIKKRRCHNDLNV